MIVRASRAQDCEALAATSARAFDCAVSTGRIAVHPAGYDSSAWHRAALGWAKMFTIVEHDHLIGGVIVFLKSATCAYLSRVWIAPEWQDGDRGTDAILRVKERFPVVAHWCDGPNGGAVVMAGPDLALAT